MEQAADKVQAESLDAQVDALLGEMNQACEKLQTQLGGDAPAAAGAGETQEAAEALDDLNEQVDELLKGVSGVTPSLTSDSQAAGHAGDAQLVRTPEPEALKRAVAIPRAEPKVEAAPPGARAAPSPDRGHGWHRPRRRPPPLPSECATGRSGPPR